MIRPLSLLALLALPATAAAQQATEEVVVTGRGLPARPGDAAFATVSIDADRIATTAADRLETVLADVAGTVSEIVVTEGSVVHDGDPIAVIKGA